MANNMRPPHTKLRRQGRRTNRVFPYVLPAASSRVAVALVLRRRSDGVMPRP